MVNEKIESIKLKLNSLGEKCIQRDLINLGLTKSILKIYYPYPELKKITRNKFCYLYEISKVKEILEIESFKFDLEKAMIRSKRGIESAEKIKTLNIEIAKNYNIKVEKIPIKQLRKLAIESWESWNESKWLNDSPEDTKRIMTNFVRHNLTVYDDLLYFQKGMIGTNEMYEILKDIITEKILEIYPELKGE